VVLRPRLTSGVPLSPDQSWLTATIENDWLLMGHSRHNCAASRACEISVTKYRMACGRRVPGPLRLEGRDCYRPTSGQIEPSRFCSIIMPWMHVHVTRLHTP